MNALFPVMAGGAIGAGLRYLAGVWLAPRGGFPVATFCVNLIGGFAMGLLAAALLREHVSETARLFIGVGVLGGFTTFSAFSLESYQMLERGQFGLAVIYVAASIFGSLAALAIGYGIMR
jgi:fluoride exporter